MPRPVYVWTLYWGGGVPKFVIVPNCSAGNPAPTLGALSNCPGTNVFKNLVVKYVVASVPDVAAVPTPGPAPTMTQFAQEAWYAPDNEGLRLKSAWPSALTHVPLSLVWVPFPDAFTYPPLLKNWPNWGIVTLSCGK